MIRREPLSVEKTWAVLFSSEQLRLPGSAKDSSDFFEILLVDMLLSCIPYAIALSLWSTLIIAVARRFKSKNMT